jgi:hypothetical protein
MTPYDRKTVATAPDGRVVLVSTVRTALGADSAVFPATKEGTVTSALRLHKVRHANDAVLDAEHEALVAGIASGEITLSDSDREPTQAEVEEAMGDLLLMDKMATDDATPR